MRPQAAVDGWLAGTAHDRLVTLTTDAITVATQVPNLTPLGAGLLGGATTLLLLGGSSTSARPGSADATSGPHHWPALTPAPELVRAG